MASENGGDLVSYEASRKSARTASEVALTQVAGIARPFHGPDGLGSYGVVEAEEVSDGVPCRVSDDRNRVSEAPTRVQETAKCVVYFPYSTPVLAGDVVVVGERLLPVLDVRTDPTTIYTIAWCGTPKAARTEVDPDFGVDPLPVATVDGVDYFNADLHIIETNANGRIVTLPADEVIWVDWGDGSPPQTKPSLTRSLTGSMDEDTAREGLRFTRAIDGPEGIQNQEVTIRAVFAWNNATVKTNLSWVKDIKQFGLNPETGERNQIQSGVRAFSQISAETLTALPGLDTSNLTRMNSMFIGATNFNQDLPDWDTSNVTQMPNMFQSATAFNGDISTWNTSKLTQLVSAFRFAESFNQDISGWDVSAVISWQETFRRAFAFDQDIGGWQINEAANESRMREMFSEATSFNQDLSGWCVPNVTSAPGGFDYKCDAWVLPRPVWGTCP